MQRPLAARQGVARQSYERAPRECERISGAGDLEPVVCGEQQQRAEREPAPAELTFSEAEPAPTEFEQRRGAYHPLQDVLWVHGQALSASAEVAPARRQAPALSRAPGHFSQPSALSYFLRP